MGGRCFGRCCARRGGDRRRWPTDLHHELGHSIPSSEGAVNEQARFGGTQPCTTTDVAAIEAGPLRLTSTSRVPTSARPDGAMRRPAPGRGMEFTPIVEAGMAMGGRSRERAHGCSPICSPMEVVTPLVAQRCCGSRPGVVPASIFARSRLSGCGGCSSCAFRVAPVREGGGTRPTLMPSGRGR
jgi:hypothetical protein